MVEIHKRELTYWLGRYSRLANEMIEYHFSKLVDLVGDFLASFILAELEEKILIIC